MLREPRVVPSLRRLLHFSLRRFQPESHAHLMVHRRRRGEVLLGLIALVGAPVQLGEPEMAMSDERAHPE